MRRLKTGERAYVLVRAEVMSNASDILVRKGERYRRRTEKGSEIATPDP